MAINIQLELTSTNKSDKKTSAGITKTGYSCVLKGSIGNVQASMTLKSDDLKALDDVLKQQL